MVQLDESQNQKKWVVNDNFMQDDKRMTESELPGDFVQLSSKNFDNNPDLYYEGQEYNDARYFK